MTPLSLHTFKVDVTPPIGLHLCGGLHQPCVGVETPLYLRGVVLSTPQTRCVIAVVDYCYTVGRSHDRFVQTLADGPGVPVSHATLHSNHVHDAPLINEEAHSILEPHVPGLHSEEYFGGVLRRTRDAIRDALAAGSGVPISGVSFTSHPVEQFASTRRCIDSDNRCHVRFSFCQDPAIKGLPEGNIDALIDLVCFHDAAGKPAVAMSFYASHPQVSDGRRLASSDTIGVALDLFAQTYPGVFAMHFDGCGGDITAGKYTSPNKPRNRLVFGVRLFDALSAAMARAKPEPLGDVAWHDHSVDLPLAPVAESAAHYESVLADDSTALSFRYLAALKLHRLRNRIDRYPFRASRLRLGDIQLLFLPAELVVDYQHFAKRQGKRVTVAAYGDCFLDYVASDHHFAQGGYEVEPDWTEIGPGTEPRIHAAIAHALSGAVS